METNSGTYPFVFSTGAFDWYGFIVHTTPVIGVVWTFLLQHNHFHNTKYEREESKMKSISKTGSLLLILTLVISVISFSVCDAAPQSNPIRVLCYGDSNTWGWIPLETGFPSSRYAPDVRWTGGLQARLGTQYQVIEEGLNGRTAGVDDFANGLYGDLIPQLNLNGMPTLLPTLKAQAPIDLVVIMLGTNDVKPYLHQDAASIAASMDALVKAVKNSCMSSDEWLIYPPPKVLVVAPVPVQPGKSIGLNEMFKGGYDISAQLGTVYADVAKANNVQFFNGATVISAADGADGIHLSPASHQKLGNALAKKIKSMF